MNKIKSTKGITLIALVITIIVLLILAGISIVILTGDNGLLNKAKDTKTATEIAKIKEEIQTDISGKQAENEGNISDDTLKGILEKYGVLSEAEEKLIDKTLTTTKGNYEIKVADIFNGTTVKDIPKEPIVADKSEASAPNVSKIAQKTYVIWNLNEAGTEYEINDTQTTQPDNWYDYENGKWANIKTTNKEEGLEAYWVWIPRYEYIVPTSTTVTQIEVKFIPTDQTEADEDYIIHPAFTNEGNGGFGELDGIWVAKFEASSNTTTPDTNYGGGIDTNLKVQVKPEVQSWRNIETKNIFTVCRKMTQIGEVLEGSSIDSHMMKNTEWGAVAILSQSKYGIFNAKSSTGLNGDKTYQVWNNSNGYDTYKKIYTGYAGNSKDESTIYNSTTAPTNVYKYNTIKGTKASTTGTVYGVYDMAGGSWEYVAGCLNGQENSKFGVTVGNSKYIDLYTNSSDSNSNYDGAKIGDATKETKGWNSDYSNFVYSSDPVFIRGRLLQLGHECR